MQIHVARPPTQLGSFSLEEVAEGLRTGRFLSTDHGWREGMAEWLPLNQWAEFADSAVPVAPSESQVSSATQPMPAWERGASVGNYFGTIKDVATNPVQTFDALPDDGSMGRSLAFHYLTAVPFYIGLFGVYALIIGVLGASAFSKFAGVGPFKGIGGILGLLAGYFTCLAIFVPLAYFLLSGVVHLSLLPWGPQGTYAKTYRAMSYVNGSFLLLMLVPFVGCFTLLWRPVVDVIALSRVHKLAWWKVMISLFVIGCLCGGAYLGLIFITTKGLRGL
jgi:hypothetical protein